MDYSQGIGFETSIVNMFKAKSLTKSNQSENLTREKKRCRCGSTNHLHITSMDCPVGFSIVNTKQFLGGVSISI